MAAEDSTSQSIKKDLLGRSLGGKKAGSNLINLQISSNAGSSQALDASGGATDQVTFTFTLENINDLRLIGMPSVSVYQTSVADANSIPDGTGGDNYQIVTWIDWGGTNNNNIVLKTYVRNLSGSPVTVLFRGNYRFLVESASI